MSVDIIKKPDTFIYYITKKEWKYVYERNTTYIKSYLNKLPKLISPIYPLWNYKSREIWVYDKKSILFIIEIINSNKKEGHLLSKAYQYTYDICIPLRVKMNESQIDLIREICVQHELSECIQMYYKKPKSHIHFSIPSIQSIFKLSQKDDTEKLCFGMDFYDGTLFDYIDIHFYTYSKPNLVRNIHEIVTSIAMVLNILQQQYKFMHRKLTGYSIVYRIQDKVYKWYMIDFDMACIEIGKNRLCPPINKQEYPFIHGFNASHDLRKLILSLYTRYHTIIKQMYPKIDKQKDDISIHDTDFEPNTIIQMKIKI